MGICRLELGVFLSLIISKQIKAVPNDFIGSVSLSKIIPSRTNCGHDESSFC
ncbi:MAG: hypothetical protein IRD7MM_06600 [Candidatus Midichloria mitochondrii]